MPRVVIVEGESDRIALETLARRRGRDLRAEGTEVVAIGGAHAIRRFLEIHHDESKKFVGLVDSKQADVFTRLGVEVERLDQQARVERFPPGLRAHEPADVLERRAVPLRGLPLQRS